MAIIRNKTRDTIIAEDYTLCSSVFSKATGLIFRRHRNLVFKFREETFVPLHMFFVFHTIDVIYINKKREIVEQKENFRPFMVFNPKNKARYVIEVKKGTIKKTNSAIGDIIEF